MKSAPLSLTGMLYVLFAVGAVVGGIVGAALANTSVDAVVAGFLCGFLPAPLVSFLRVRIGSFLARNSGIDGPPPYPFSLPVRLAIAAAIALVVSVVFFPLTSFPVNAYTGAAVALFATMGTSLVMVAKLTLFDSGDKPSA